MNSAVKNNIKRLYFLARDSWLPYKCALYINDRLGLGLDIRYIYVSRYTLRNAQYAFIGEEALETICVGGIDITLRKILQRANLTDEEIIAVADSINFKGREDEILSYAQVQDVKNRLYQSIKVFEYIRVHSQMFYHRLKEYLIQEGFCDDVSYAIVDSGWLGTTQESMQQVLEHITGKSVQLTGFYFGLYQLPAHADSKHYHSFYLRPNKDIKRKTRFSICLYETIISEPCGMTLGYRKSNEKMTPVLSNKGNPNTDKIKRGFRILNEYLNNMKIDSDFLKTDERKVIEKLLMLSMGKPTATEAKVMGALLFCDDVLESGMQDVARRWNKRELFKQSFLLKIFFKFTNSKVKLHESGWPEGSIVNLCGEGVTSKIALINERGYKWGMYLRKAISA